MSKHESAVFLHAGDDPKIEQAAKLAQQSFRFFWREVAWESRRIVPGLDVACVKVAFSDPPGQATAEDAPQVEQMWINDVNFDGLEIRGTLINQPNWLTSVSEGDSVCIHPRQLTDWMYAIDEVVYGGYTVNVLRAQMKKKERSVHDDAWGLKFGDPKTVLIVPPEYLGQSQKQGLFAGSKQAQTVAQVAVREHPMALNMRESLEEMLQNDPSTASAADERGFTLLHELALAGTAAGVEALLPHATDVNLAANNGMTPLKLAKSLGWRQVISKLTASGAN